VRIGYAAPHARTVKAGNSLQPPVKVPRPVA
jgi:hypothetical protein